jgi:hypothetical protein
MPVCVIAGGAVNTPADVIVPAVALHVTVACPDAVNVCVPPNVTVTADGATVTGPLVVTGGFSVIVAMAVLVELAALAAVSVTVVFAVIDEGAVYVIAVPDADVAALKDPAPDKVQFTCKFDVFATVAVKFCVCDALRFAAAGLTEIVIAGKLMVYAAVVTALSVDPDL